MMDIPVDKLSRCISYGQVDSTNRIAKELATEGKAAPGTVVLAVSQSAGRGQYGRSFNSPAGGLYFSLLLEPNLPTEILPLITLATGLACRTVLYQSFGLHPFIKWPNDIYLGGKKIAGILCENLLCSNQSGTRAKVIIGVGLNVNSKIEDFPAEIKPTLTTLFEQIHETVELEPLLIQLIRAITSHVIRIQDERESLFAEWRQFDFLLHKRVLFHMSEGRTLHGIGLGLSAQGLYTIQDDKGLEHQVIGGQLRLQE